MERKEAIERLKQLRLDYTEFWEEIKNETTEALDIAIASLETDEAYQLEYERTTKNDLGVSSGLENVSSIIDWNNCHTSEQLDSISTTKNDLEVDTISRQEAIDTIRQLYLDLASQKAVIDILKVLSSVTPQESRWIPVSEKLPNDRNWYLGIFKEPDTGWINPLPFICYYVGRETKATTKGYWILRGFTDWDDYHIDYYFNLECVAWMPLPLPWKGE